MTEEAMAAEPAAEPVSAPEPQAEPQASEAPDTTEAPKPVSRMEALEKAFKATESKPDAPKEPAPEKPTEPSSEDGQPRGPDGKFVAKDAQEPQSQPETPKEPVQEAKPTEPNATISEAPSRFSPDAKAAWKDAPEAVRGEAMRAIRELESGIQQKDQVLEPLKPYLKMAQDSGTTIHDALSRYINMEQALRQDLPRGMQMLAQNMGMTLGDLVQQITGQPQEQQQAAKDQTILQLQQQIEDLKGQIGEVSTSYQNDRLSSVESEVAKFAEQNPRFDELAEEIGRQIQAGFDLPTAYQRAEMLNPLPQVQTPQPAAPQPPAQTREVKSVTGSPAAGSNPATRKPSATREEALARAFAQTGLA